MINSAKFAVEGFASSYELKQVLSVSAKRNSLTASIVYFIASLLALVFGYGYLVVFTILLISIVFFGLSRNTNVENFRIQERLTFVSSTFVLIGLLFVTDIVTTVVIFLPCLSYLFLVETNRKVRWITVGAIVVALAVSGLWFFPNLTLNGTSYERRYEALFDVILAASFTGVFVRFHMEFLKLSVWSAKQQAKTHQEHVNASEIAREALEKQKQKLDKIYETSQFALQNERLLHAQIAASQDQLEQFAYAASHDLKEPIRTIRSFLQVVHRRLSPEVIEEEGLKEHFEFVDQSSVAMHNLLERLLVYSRIEKASQVKSSVDMVKVLQRVCSDPAMGLNAIGAEVSVSLPEGRTDAAVYMNQEHLATVFKEIFNNSVLFRSKERSLQVKVEAEFVDEDRILVTIADNGIGIETKYCEQVFGLFKRLNAREDYPGSGLGLSLVKAIVEAIGGQVSLSSLLGEGTQVHLLLPRKGS